MATVCPAKAMARFTAAFPSSGLVNTTRSPALSEPSAGPGLNISTVLPLGSAGSMLSELTVTGSTSPEDGNAAVKRAIAFAGQTVAIEDSVLVVDGVQQAEPGIDHSRIDGTYFGPVTVPAGHVFVLGDNRAGSIDSRIYGSVPLESLQATVLWPFGR